MTVFILLGVCSLSTCIPLRPSSGARKEGKTEGGRNKHVEASTLCSQADLQSGFFCASHPNPEDFSYIPESSAMPDFANKTQGAQLNLTFRKAANTFFKWKHIPCSLGYSYTEKLFVAIWNSHLNGCPCFMFSWELFQILKGILKMFYPSRKK